MERKMWVKVSPLRKRGKGRSFFGSTLTRSPSRVRKIKNLYWIYAKIGVKVKLLDKFCSVSKSPKPETRKYLED